MWIMVGASFDGTTFGNSLGACHHQGAAQVTETAGRFGLDGVFAFGIIGTAVKKSKSPSFFHHKAIFASRASDTGAVFLFEFGIFFDVLAFGIVGARNKSAVLAVPLDKFAVFAVGTSFTGFFWTLHFLAGNFSGADTIRIFGAT